MVKDRIIFYKILLLGESQVGKTSIRKNYMGQGYTSNYQVTMGADFATKTIEFLDNENGSVKVGLQIWDIAGQDTFDKIRSRFLAYASGIILVCDITKMDTFLKLSYWLEEVWKINKTRKLPILLIGNKLDLDIDREIYTSLLEHFVRDVKTKFPSVPYFEVLETSALTGENIDLGFEQMARILHENSQ